MLIVDDEPESRQLLARIFDDAYRVFEADDGEAGLALATRVSPAVVISDQRMPGLSGIALLTHLKERLPTTVRILVTGFSDHGAIVEAVNSAAVHHYLEKPFHVREVRAVVDTLVRTAELETQRDALLTDLRRSVERAEQLREGRWTQADELDRVVEERTGELRRDNVALSEANRKLQDVAVRDSLTALFNHRHFIEQLDREVARCQRYGRHCSLLFVDIDDFKQINDRCGHQIGDRVLQRIAELLDARSSGLRHCEFAARYGGEEFCVLLPETGIDGARVKAERIRHSIATVDWSAAVEGLRGKVTVSIGVAEYPAHGEDSQELLRGSDEAL